MRIDHYSLNIPQRALTFKQKQMRNRKMPSLWSIRFGKSGSLLILMKGTSYQTLWHVGETVAKWNI